MSEELSRDDRIRMAETEQKDLQYKCDFKPMSLKERDAVAKRMSELVLELARLRDLPKDEDHPMRNVSQARELCKKLAAAGIAQVEMSYHGAGDEGYAEGITYTDKDEKSIDGDFDNEVEEVLFEDAVCVHNDGFWNDAGGGGEAKLNVEEQTITVDHYDYYQEVASQPTQTFKL